MLQQKQLNLVVGFYNNFNRISIKFPTDYQKIYKTIQMIKLNSINEMNIDSVDTSIHEKVVYVIRLWHTFNRLAVIPYLQILGNIFERINKTPNGPDIFEALLEINNDIFYAAVQTTRGCLLIPNVDKDNIEENIMYQKLKININEFVFTTKGALYCPKNISILEVQQDIKNTMLNETGPEGVFVWNKLLNNKVSSFEPGLIVTFKKDKEYRFSFPIKLEDLNKNVKRNNIVSLSNTEIINIEGCNEYIKQHILSTQSEMNGMLIDTIQTIGYLLQEIKRLNKMNQFEKELSSSGDYEMAAIKTLFSKYNGYPNKFEVMQLVKRQLVMYQIIPDPMEYLSFLNTLSKSNKKEY